jgi:hypothetical protein
MHGVSRTGDVEPARVLLDHGADMSAEGYDEFTPLHLAAYYGRLKIVQFLLESKANLNARDADNRTPLSGFGFGIFRGRTDFAGAWSRLDYPKQGGFDTLPDRYSVGAPNCCTTSVGRQCRKRIGRNGEDGST